MFRRPGLLGTKCSLQPCRRPRLGWTARCVLVSQTHAARTLPVQQLSKQPVRFHMEGPLSLDPHWLGQAWKPPLRLPGGIWGTNATLRRRTLCDSGKQLTAHFARPAPSSSLFLLHSSWSLPLCWTAWTNNPLAALISCWSITPLGNMSRSKRRLVLSALLVCAIIFELGKWLHSLSEQFCEHEVLESQWWSRFLWNAWHVMNIQSNNIHFVLNYLRLCSYHPAYCKQLMHRCAACCQEQRTTPGRKSKPGRVKPGKSANKGPRNVTVKTKVKATPAAPTQTLLTQVFQLEYRKMTSSMMCFFYSCLIASDSAGGEQREV